MKSADSKPKLLIVEDDPGLAKQLKWAYDDFETHFAATREEAINLLRAEDPGVVTLDLGLPPDPDGVTEGMATLAEIVRLAPDTKVIVASGHGAHQSALDAIAGGAWDFYSKPVNIDELRRIVDRAFHVHALEAENRRLQAAGGDEERLLGTIVSASPEMTKVARMIERVASTNVSVMLLGASGTGKELCARGLHSASDRADKPFIAINCAAIPETLLESELFGHEKGAFTGAIKTTIGKIEQANGGTLFLDEVGDIPLPLQVKLLRFLQERVVERIGGREVIPVDVRIVTATHRDLEKMIAEENFREDLFYRLAEIVIKIPALAERTGDPVLLAKHFLRRYAEELGSPVTGFTAEALSAIDGWAWPGNVRELENRIKRAAIMADDKLVRLEDLDFEPDNGEAAEMINLRAVRESADRSAIRRAMSRTQGNVSGAAKLLGISRPTLYDLMKQHQISH